MANTKRRVACYTRIPTTVATTEDGQVVKLSPNRRYWEDKIQMEFESMAEAARQLDLHKSGLCRALGDENYQCGGMYWRYID